MAKLAASLANRDDFGMRRRIIRRSNAIRRLGNNFAALGHHRREWPAAPAANILERKFDRAFHAARICVFGHSLRPRNSMALFVEHKVHLAKIVAQANIDENDSTFLRQKSSSAIPIMISATLKPIHNPAAPHPTAKHK